MARPDFRGARGSNAGDDFHELWALRHALSLLQPDTDLRELMVEGVAEHDEAGSDIAWDGVDCTLYQGAPNSTEFTRIVIEQLKYSSADPTTAWTVGRLTRSTAKTGNNSVLRGLATAWRQLSERYPTLSACNAITVRIISNQGPSTDLAAALDAVSNASTSSATAQQAESLRAASGLPKALFKKFVAALDISHLGQDTRLSLETQIIQTIASWTDDNSRLAVSELTRFIRRKMAPDERGRTIAKEDVLAHFGVSDPASLFPCPCRIKHIDNTITRSVTSEIARKMEDGQQLLCLHGNGGTGKTTVVQQLASRLPVGSEVIIFDCYGAGTYMNSNAYRHPPQYAFLQLINELSARLRIPYLLLKSADEDYPRLFMKQLSRAAALVATANTDALLVIVIDAADNSIDAAAAMQPGQRSFVYDFLMLGTPPSNVRFLVSARTGRLDKLGAPASFERVPLGGFSLAETATHVRSIWPDISDFWVEDFHYLSSQLPRVQAYAIKAARGDSNKALQYLRPAGKGLADIFRGQIDDAIRKQADPSLFNRFCAGLIALPRPIPMEALATTIGLSTQHCMDIALDLSPGLTTLDGLVNFADEDFETYVREQAAGALPDATRAVADHLYAKRRQDAYAATHVASALYSAGRAADVLALVAPEEAPNAITDPVHKRRVEIKRLQMAVKVCRDTGDNVESVLTLIRGARALKTDTALRRLLVENSDLSALYAREVAVRAILQDPTEIQDHGALLSDLAGVEARHGRKIEVRELRRQLRAWFGRREVELAKLRGEHPNYEPFEWRIEPDDLTGLLEAVLRTEAPDRVVGLLQRWPRHFAFRAARLVSMRVAARGEFDLLRAVADAMPRKSPWRFIATLPLILAGESVDVSDIVGCIAAIARAQLVSADELSAIWDSTERIESDFYDCIILACEVALHQGASPETVRPLLSILTHQSTRAAGQVMVSRTTMLDISLRAYALLQEFDGKPLTYDTYLIQPPEPPVADKGRPQQQRSPRRDEEKDYITLLLPIYETRAKAFLRRLTSAAVASAMQSAVGRMAHERWRIERHHSAGLAFDLAAQSVAQLMLISGIDQAALRSVALEMLTSDPLASKASELFRLFSLRHDQHSALLTEIVKRAIEIKQLKWSANERSRSVMKLCRVLTSISPEDARLLFNNAVAISEEIDEESTREIALVEPLVAKAVLALNDAGRRQVAQRLVAVSAEMALRLDSPDGFPWSSIVGAMSDLDTPVALAAIAQWDDIGRAHLSTTLPAFINHAIRKNKIDAATAVALLPLLVSASEKTVSAVARHASGHPALVDLIARDELLVFGLGGRSAVNDDIRAASGNPPLIGFVGKLSATAEFLAKRATQPRTATRDTSLRLTDTAESDLLASIDWTSFHFEDPDTLENFLDTNIRSIRKTASIFFARTLLNAAQARVPIAERIGYLRVLSKCHPKELWSRDIASSLVACAKAWIEMPSIKEWCRRELPSVIADELPTFTHYLAEGEAVLRAAIVLVESEGAVRDALLSGVEAHFDELDAPTVYALAGIIGSYCSSPEAARIVDRHSSQLLQDLPPDEQALPAPSEYPSEIAAAIARFIFALLSDVDIHRRWRAAHAARRFIEHGSDKALPELIATYSRISDNQFRDPKAPFHWHAARLWLMIALARACVDKPVEFTAHLPWFKSVVADASYPHLLVRSYALDVIDTVGRLTGAPLDKTERATLAKFVVGAVKRKSLPPKQYSRIVPMRNLGGKRFQFDSMDTLPYWYEPAARVFADLTGEEFVAEAERWIVDQWGVTEGFHRWGDDPRRHRYGDGFDTTHRHGSLPQKERYHTFLEWHAMWCVVGSYIATRPLVRRSDDVYHDLEEWLASSKLTLAPRWLADLRDAKPLHPDWWLAPAEVSDAWLDDTGLEDALSFLSDPAESNVIVANASAEARSDTYTIAKRVSSALVSPNTAADLMRALQTADSEQDYWLPDEDHDQEIEHGDFRLLGWLASVQRDTAFDGEDPLRYGARAPYRRPGRRIAMVHQLHQRWRDSAIEWVTKSGEIVFAYRCWGDTRGDEHERQRRYSSDVRSDGTVLSVDRKALKEILTTLGMDLIVEVTLTRSNFSYESSSRIEEKGQKSQPHDFVILLRQGGEIETVEGRVGTWQTSG